MGVGEEVSSSRGPRRLAQRARRATVGKIAGAGYTPRVLPTPCWIVSDTHLGASPPEVERDLLGFLRAARVQAKSVVINGDLFDFWFEWRTVMPRHGFRVIAAIADLVDAGLPVVWMAGNHDAWGDQMLRNEIGVDFRFEAWRGAIGGWQAHIEHGDGLREVEDRGYRRVRRVLRARWAISALRLLHPDLATRLALGSSAGSRHRSGAPDGAGLERVALAMLDRERTTTLVSFGHTHVRRLLRAPAGGVYANSGGWERGAAFVRVLDDEVELREWRGSGDGDRLDVLERLPEEARRLP